MSGRDRGKRRRGVTVAGLVLLGPLLGSCEFLESAGENVRVLSVVSIGDSYASGEGSPAATG